MTDTLRDRIAAVLYDHWSTYGNDCECGWNCAKELSFSANYEAHVADAVIAELEMTRESAVDGISPVDDPPPGQHRYVTDWIDDD